MEIELHGISIKSPLTKWVCAYGTVQLNQKFLGDADESNYYLNLPSVSSQKQLLLRLNNTQSKKILLFMVVFIILVTPKKLKISSKQRLIFCLTEYSDEKQTKNQLTGFRTCFDLLYNQGSFIYITFNFFRQAVSDFN